MDKKTTHNSIFCYECGLKINGNGYFIIDELPVCYRCLFGEVEPISIYPIGRVIEKDDEGISRVDLFPYQQKFMYKLEEEERITIIYYLHKTDSIITIFNRGKDRKGKKVGVFASRTPKRTSRIAVSEVSLVRISGNSIYVRGLDAFIDSPVLDIKASKS
ncbi:MAG: hypothetical protein GX240_07030, partial [Candidatus Atribacteria bacterium]|nr:hypothetical protein [Candidatus Atribacteria bacterium]